MNVVAMTLHSQSFSHKPSSLFRYNNDLNASLSRVDLVELRSNYANRTLFVSCTRS